MTQQPYYPPQYPQFPQQPAPPYPQQGYPQPQIPQPPAAQPVQGTLDDYYNQPSGGGGPSISWKGKTDGSTYAGIVARDVTHADVQQDTDPQTRQPRFYKDGRPKFSMKVPLKVQPSAEFPEGEAALYVRGQMRDELVRAMGERQCEGAPKAGDAIQVTLVQRKPIPGAGIPMNVFAISFQPGPSWVPSGTGVEAPSPAATPPTVDVSAAAQPASTEAVQAAPAVPEGLNPEQAALLAKLTGGQA